MSLAQKKLMIAFSFLNVQGCRETNHLKVYTFTILFIIDLGKSINFIKRHRFQI